MFSIARLNAARLLARIVEQNKDASETQADVLARLAGTNQGQLADALSAIIKDPAQNDGARFWAFRALRLLLALPQPTPPTLPRELKSLPALATSTAATNQDDRHIEIRAAVSGGSNAIAR